jgi:hypothetical protein
VGAADDAGACVGVCARNTGRWPKQSVTNKAQLAEAREEKEKAREFMVRQGLGAER